MLINLVPKIIVTNHSGMKVLGIYCMTDSLNHGTIYVATYNRIANVKSEAKY